jgi:tetratricopeptide (TPR) repeat protein
MQTFNQHTRNVALALLVTAAAGITSFAADAPTTGPASTAPATTAAGISASSSAAARGRLAEMLVQEARGRSRDTHLPAALAARQACTLLQAANAVDPSDLVTLRLLADAAHQTRQPAVLRDTLRQTLKLDPANLVAQVEYLDLLATSTETLDDRARIYQAAMDKPTLDPQVRSEMAVRLAAILDERGETEQAAKLLKAALQFNDVNVTALQGLARMASQGTPQERLTSLTNLLAVDPYQPEAWLAGARVLAAANVHNAAGDWFGIGLEQTRLAGATPAAEMYLDLATELAIAGRRAESEPALRQLAALPDAPLMAVVLAQAVTQEAPPPATTAPATAPATEAAPGVAEGPATAATTEPTDAATKLRDRLAANIKADPKNARVVGDALLTAAELLPDLGAELSVGLETYRSLVPPDDKMLAAIEGWKYLQQGKFDLARERLLPVADQGVMNRLGLARAYAGLRQTDEARKILQEIYNGQPTGLTALLTTQAARRAGVRLIDPAGSKELLELTRRIPSANYTAHRQPRDLVLASATLTKRRYGLDEPVIVTIKQSNTTERALPVGPNGVVRTMVGIAGATRGLGAIPLGMFATGDCARLYRLERRNTLQYDLRADQGLLADLLEVNPTRSFTIGLTVLIAPRGNAKEYAVALGGQTLGLADIEKSGTSYRSIEDVAKAIKALPGLPPEQQMTAAWALSVVLAGIPEEAVRAAAPEGGTPGAGGASDLAVLRTNLTNALLAQVNSESPVMVAWMMRMAPRTGLPDELDKALDKTPPGGEAAPAFSHVARMMWAERCAALADAQGGPARAAAIDRLKELAGHEGDTLTRAWFGELVKELNLPGSATAPAVKNRRADLQVGAATQTSGTRSDPRVTPPTATPQTNP